MATPLPHSPSVRMPGPAAAPGRTDVTRAQGRGLAWRSGSVGAWPGHTGVAGGRGVTEGGAPAWVYIGRRVGWRHVRGQSPDLWSTPGVVQGEVTASLLEVWTHLKRVGVGVTDPQTDILMDDKGTDSPHIGEPQAEGTCPAACVRVLQPLSWELEMGDAVRWAQVALQGPQHTPGWPSLTLTTGRRGIPSAEGGS